jgi:hypothetical protein
MKRKMIGFIVITGIAILWVGGVVWTRTRENSLPFTVIHQGSDSAIIYRDPPSHFPYQNVFVMYTPMEAEPYFAPEVLEIIQQQNFEEKVVLYVEGVTGFYDHIEIGAVRPVGESHVLVDVNRIRPPRDPALPVELMLRTPYQLVTLDKHQFAGRNMTFTMELEGEPMGTFYREWAEEYSTLLITPTPVVISSSPVVKLPQIAVIARQWLAFREGLSPHQIAHMGTLKFPATFPDHTFYLVSLKERFTDEIYRIVITEQHQTFMLQDVPFGNVPPSHPFP